MAGFLDEGSEGRRSRLEAALASVMSPPYLVLPPTQRFRHTVACHGDHGLVAVLMFEGMIFENVDTGAWEDGRDTILDPDVAAREAAFALADAARAPPGRVGCVVWLPNAVGAGPPRLGLCTSPNPADLARAVQYLMESRLSGIRDPMAPWIGAYAAMALGPKGGMDPGLKAIVGVIESVVAATVLDMEVQFHGDLLVPEDLADPRYMLPALATAAFEDWGLVVRGAKSAPDRPGAKGRGFSLDLEPDPAALLGYRVERLTPSAPFIVLAPLISTLRRFRRRDAFVVDDLAEQFGRYLRKHGLDATIVEEVSLRVLAGGGDE